MLPILTGSAKRKTSAAESNLWMPSAATMWYHHARFRYGAMCMVAFLIFLMVSSLSSVSLTTVPSKGYELHTKLRRPPGSKKHDGMDRIGPVRHNYNLPNVFEIGMVADLDKKSKVTDSKKTLFQSLFQKAELRRVKATGSNLDSYSIIWGETVKFSTKMNEGGRGFELSELQWFNGHLYTFDDRTGIMFRLSNFEMDSLKSLVAIPEHILTEGNGDTDKGQKHEWAAVKDGELYIGSIGKEFTDGTGNVVHRNNLWVSVVGKDGSIRHEDWTEKYDRIRASLGCSYPGYVIHEAIEWSSFHQKWFVLPRRVSVDAYDEVRDEKKGSNKLLIANEDFSSIDIRDIGTITPERGFSSFKFVPNTEDSVIVAIKSMENEEEQTQGAFITVFDLDNNILMEEIPLPGNHKYEGISFLNDYSDTLGTQ